MADNKEIFKDLFPYLYKINRIKEIITEYESRTNGFFSRYQQNEIGEDAIDKIRELLG